VDKVVKFGLHIFKSFEATPVFLKVAPALDVVYYLVGNHYM